MQITLPRAVAGLVLIGASTAALAQEPTRRVSPTTTATVNKEGTLTTTASAGEVGLSPWQMTAAQFRADIEPINVPVGCAAHVNRADVSRITIKSDLYRPGMISPDSAKFLALCVIPGQISSGEMHVQDGRTMYEVSLIPDRRSTNAKVIIDANTGEVLSSKTYGGLRGLAGFLRENIEREENKNPAAVDTLARQPSGVMCTMEARPAVQVTVRDEHGMPIAPTTRIRVVARDGMYVDSLSAAGDRATFALALERPGTYQIEVSAPGFVTTSISGVVVAKTTDGCHVETRQLTAHLKR